MQRERAFHILFVLAILLALPAFIINLGLHAFIEDEAIRALVALEMGYSGNYIVPTLNGSFYYSKPPLYNWFIVLSFKIWGVANEWSARFPTLIFTALFCYTIYRSNKPYFKNKHAPVLLALFFLTCGRIIFWDSFLGLIDICFSWVMYMLFMAVWKFGHKKQYLHMFVWTYFLGAAGFLFKGYPALLFIGATLLVMLWMNRDLLKVFSLKHLAGIAVFVTIVGGYYWSYSLYNEASDTIAPLLDQSTRRTILKYGIWDTIKHLFTYPFENIYHFLPWSFLFLFLLRKDVYARLKESPFFMFSAFVFLVNIIPYWFSPEVYPRYILMLIPLAFSVFMFFYELDKDEGTWRLKCLDILFKAIVLIVPLGILSGFFEKSIYFINGWQAILIGFSLATAFLAYLYFKWDHSRFIILVNIVLMLRIGFDLLVLPTRHSEDFATITKEAAIQIGKKYDDKALFIYKNSKVDYTGSFYLAKTRGTITHRKFADLNTGDFCIVDTSKQTVPLDISTLVDSFPVREDRKMMYIVQIKQ